MDGNRLNIKDIEFYASADDEVCISTIRRNNSEVIITLDNLNNSGALLCIASYNNEELVDVSIINTSYNIAEYSVTISDEATKVKVMLWEFENIKPMCEFKEINWRE